MFVGRDVGESLLEFVNTLHSGWGVRNELPMLTIQGGVMLAHAVGRSATVVKALTGENFTLTLDLQRLSSLICDLSVSYRTFDLLYFPIHTCTCNLV